jgi:pyruvate/2-oxoglutarate dehydrogenase complex dihydrolipoamide acyltransferase (E2) component
MHAAFTVLLAPGGGMGVAAAQQHSISALDCLNRLAACTPAGLQHLRHLELDSLHLLRLLSTTHAADQSWTTAVPAAGAAASDGGGGVRRLLGTGSSNDGVGGSAAVGLPGSSSLPPQQQLQGSQERGLPVAQSPQEAAAAADAAAAAEAPAAAEKEEQQQGDELLLWGELFARAPRRGLAVLLPPRRRQDVAEQLIARVSML